MTEKHYRVEAAKVSVRLQETKVRDAAVALEQGYRELQAQLERGYVKLKSDLEREKMNLERDKHWLDLAEAELARGFDLGKS